MMITVHDLRHVNTDVVEAWAADLGLRLRKGDLDELEVTLPGMDPSVALVAATRVSTHAYAITSQSAGVIAMFGAAPTALPGVGSVWMLGSDDIQTEAVGIARRTRRYFNELNKPYPILWNHIDARNEVSLRWLEWGGFQLLQDVEIDGHPFHLFARTTHVPSSGGSRRNRGRRGSGSQPVLPVQVCQGPSQGDQQPA